MNDKMNETTARMEARGSAEPIYHLNAKLGLVELGGSAPDCRFFLSNIRIGGKSPSPSGLIGPVKVCIERHPGN